MLYVSYCKVETLLERNYQFASQEMFANKYYERDIEYAFSVTRFFFRILGIWPLVPANSLLELMKTIALVFACFAFFLCEMIPALLYMFIIMKDIRSRFRIMSYVIFTIVEITKYCYMLLHKSQMRNCLMLVEKDWQNVVNPNDRITMIDKVRSGKYVIVACAAFVYISGVAVRIIMPLAMGKIVTPQNITIRPLPSVAHLVILDVQRSPVYEITFLILFIAGLMKRAIMVATFAFVTLCAVHFCAQSDILMTLMNDFVNENRQENLNKKLTTVVEHQIKIRNFLQLVQSVTQYPCLIEVLGSTLLICFAGYYILELKDHSIVGLFSFTIGSLMFVFNLYVYCYMGEQIIEQGEKVALTACTLKWYHLPNDKARALVLLIVISEVPLKLKAGNIIDLSLRTFSNVIKMAVTYLNFFRTVG